MTAAEFRRIALSFPEAIESEHMQHPDFRVRGKIFATLSYPDKGHGVIILPIDAQAKFAADNSRGFSAVKGFWGRRGATQLHLAAANAAVVKDAMALAWRRVAPKRLAQK